MKSPSLSSDSKETFTFLIKKKKMNKMPSNKA